jgi:hypothetical protein
MALALLAHALFFVRVALLFAPDLYLGPSGADRVFYYAYARSLVVDGDLDFHNEMALRPPSSGLRERDGRVFNRYPIGSPLLALPTYAAAHGAILTARAAGWTTAEADGYGRPYALAYALGQLGWATLGFWRLYRIGCRFFPPRRAALGVGAAMFASPLLRYTAADLMMSHAASFFATTWTLDAALRLRAAPDRRRRWLELGVAAAWLLAVRQQNLVYLVVPAWALWSALPVGRRAAGAVAATALGASAGLAPQLLASKAVHGVWVASPYASDLRFDPRPAAVLDALAAPDRLGPWLPVLVLGAAGCIALAWARRDGLLLACAAGSLAAVALAALWAYPDVIARSAFDNLATTAIGFGAITARFRVGGVALSSACVVWNVPFVLVDRAGNWPETLSAWWTGLRWLL